MGSKGLVSSQCTTMATSHKLWEVLKKVSELLCNPYEPNMVTSYTFSQLYNTNPERDHPCPPSHQTEEEPDENQNLRNQDMGNQDMRIQDMRNKDMRNQEMRSQNMINLRQDQNQKYTQQHTITELNSTIYKML